MAKLLIPFNMLNRWRFINLLQLVFETAQTKYRRNLNPWQVTVRKFLDTDAMKIETTFKLASACVFAVMLTVAVLPYNTSVATRDGLGNLEQVLAREQQFESLLDSLRDAETGQRGFVITGKESFLSPYYGALAQLPALRRTLVEESKTTTDQKAIEHIFSLADLKLAELAETIALRRTKGFAVVEPIVSSERGKKYMDDLRAMIDAQSALSFKKRNLLRLNLERTTSNALYTSLAVTLGNLLLLGALLILMLRLLSERMHVSTKLRHTSDNLRLSNDESLLRNKQMEVSAAMLHALGAVQTLPETSTIIAKFCAKLFPDLAGILYLYRNSRDLLEPHSTWGTAEMVPEPFEPNECWALKRGSIHHSATALDLNCAHYAQKLRDDAEHLCLPLVSQGEVIGLLHVTGPSYIHPTFPHRNLLDRTAEQIALAVSNVALRETLKLQSIVDPLTGMFNRRYMDETLKRELMRAERKKSPLALIVLDLDHFKNINDTYGHDAGDYVLTSVARQMIENIRDSDLACRFGGEEIILIMPECDQATAIQRAEKIRASIMSLDLRYAGNAVGLITASFGVAQFPEHGRDASSLIHAADQAMYRAKKAGRNRVMLAQS